MKNKFILMILAIALILTSFVGCAKTEPIADEEAAAILTELVPKSEKINEMIWGEGLPIEEGQDGPLETVTAAQYRRVAENAPYHSFAEMKAAIAEVYSDDFIAKTINYTAFEGAEDALDGNTSSKVYPRYYEEDGVLWTDITNKGFDLTTEIDPSSAKVVDANGNKQIVEVKAIVAGEQMTLSLTIVEQESGWRLDTPTY